MAEGRRPVRPEAFVPWAVLLVPTVAAAAAAVALALASWQGFDFTDEGLYLLTARRPEVAYRAFSGAHFLIAPVFDLVGHRVGVLRLVKLLVVLAAGGFLGWALDRWLLASDDRGATPARVGGWWTSPCPFVTALGGLMIYSWTPLSPSYNDVSVLMVTLAAALTMLIVVEPSRRRWPFALGAVQFCHLLSKWPAALVASALVWAVVVLAVVRRDRHSVVSLVTWAGAGFLVAAGSTHLFLADLSKLVPAMLEANRVVGTSANQPTNLRAIYIEDLFRLARQVAARMWWVVPVAAVIGVLERTGRRRGREWQWAALGLAGFASIGLAVTLARAGVVRGGAPHVDLLRQVLPSCLVFALAVPIVSFMARPRTSQDHGRVGWRAIERTAVVVLLLVLPLAQAVGTGNALTVIATMASAPWVAVLMIVALTTDRLLWSARLLGLGVAAISLVSVAMVALTGQYDYPYRLGTPRAGQTTSVDAVEPLRGISVDPRQARFLTDLDALYRSHEPAPGQRLFALWSVPGLTFALDAVQPGDAWLSSTSPERVAASISSACSTDPHLRAGELPFLLVSLPEVPPIVAAAVGECGAPFPACYQVAGSVAMPPGQHAGVPITLWVPVDPC